MRPLPLDPPRGELERNGAKILTHAEAWCTPARTVRSNGKSDSPPALGMTPNRYVPCLLGKQGEPRWADGGRGVAGGGDASNTDTGRKEGPGHRAAKDDGSDVAAPGRRPMGCRSVPCGAPHPPPHTRANEIIHHSAGLAGNLMEAGARETARLQTPSEAHNRTPEAGVHTPTITCESMALEMRADAERRRQAEQHGMTCGWRLLMGEIAAAAATIGRQSASADALHRGVTQLETEAKELMLAAQRGH